MSNFHSIDYSKMIYSGLRDYFAVNKKGKLSFMYIFLMCVCYPLQQIWNNFEVYRKKTWLISQTKWQVGQLTNLLNYLYDPTNSISIDQAASNQVYATNINYDPIIWASVITDSGHDPVYLPLIGDNPQLSGVIIHIPAALNNNVSLFYDFLATLEKIRPLGIFYTIQSP